jgi:hypothetical protein
MEEAVCTCRNSLVAIYTTRAEYADRRLLTEHHAGLHTRSVGAKKDIGWFLYTNLFLDKEGVLHVTSRVLRCKVEQGIHMVIVLYLRTFCYSETYAREDVDNLLTNE